MYQTFSFDIWSSLISQSTECVNGYQSKENAEVIFLKPQPLPVPLLAVHLFEF